MNWENQDKDPWGNKNDAPDFDELMKKFSSILGGKKSSSNGSGGGGNNTDFKGFKFPSSKIFIYALLAFQLYMHLNVYISLMHPKGRSY